MLQPASPAFPRRTTRPITVGPVSIGGSAPVRIQSMTNTDTRNSQQTLEQIFRMSAAGCEIVRVAVPDAVAAKTLPAIVKASPIPVIADIHFDHKLALAAIKAGVQGLRINPGNIGGPGPDGQAKTGMVVDAARDAGIPIRIGVNAGSLEKHLLHQYGGPTAEAMCQSALRLIALLEQRNFYNIKVSLKASSVPLTLGAYRLLAKECDYPFHIGITEAGTLRSGTVTSSVGAGLLLAEGLGDTMRVSLTHDPVEEVRVAWHILSALEIRRRGPKLISCPTCGRTEIDLIGLAQAVEEQLESITSPITVAVMGCPVNGPGEARDADVGIAGGRGRGVLFRKGEVVGSVTGNQNDLLQALMLEVHKVVEE